MNPTLIRLRKLALPAIAVVAIGLAGPAPRVEAQRGAPLPPEVVRLARELETVREVAEDGNVNPPEQRADPDAPVNALRSARAELGDLTGSAGPKADRSLRAALQEVDQAWRAFNAGSPDLSHLRQTTDALHKAELRLRKAARSSDRGARPRIEALQADLAAIAERMAGDVLARAATAGVRPGRLTAAQRRFELGLLAAQKGKYEVAVVHHGGAMKLAANTVTFDVELFEQNITDALAGKTVGHAFSIAYQGQLYQGGESAGLARTSADSPERDQSPTKEMHVASVSKTLTAIVLLRLLEENGLTPDALVAPYLPSNWTLGAGVGSLTFRDFMKHESGFAQKGAGSSYNDLRTAIALPVGSTSFQYSNANYGLMRVLSSRLQGIDMAAFPSYLSSALSTAMFLIYAQDIYDSIGVEVDCESNDPSPTIQYNLPHGGASGYLEPDRRLACGGYGWFISSTELAAVLANLRHTENLMSNEMRAVMEDNFLGFMDPAEYGWIGGDFGVYRMHGGDWFHGSGEAHACAVTFPIQVEVGLVINSERGAMPYQCDLLQIAFEDAWVAD